MLQPTYIINIIIYHLHLHVTGPLSTPGKINNANKHSKQAPAPQNIFNKTNDIPRCFVGTNSINNDISVGTVAPRPILYNFFLPIPDIRRKIKNITKFTEKQLINANADVNNIPPKNIILLPNLSDITPPA
jgi:hypothetical protein